MIPFLTDGHITKFIFLAHMKTDFLFLISDKLNTFLRSTVLHMFHLGICKTVYKMCKAKFFCKAIAKYDMLKTTSKLWHYSYNVRKIASTIHKTILICCLFLLCVCVFLLLFIFWHSSKKQIVPYILYCYVRVQLF